MGGRSSFGWRCLICGDCGDAPFRAARLRALAATDERARIRAIRLGDDYCLHRTSARCFWSASSDCEFRCVPMAQAPADCRSSIFPCGWYVSVGCNLGYPHRSDRNCVCTVGLGYVLLSIQRRSCRGHSAALNLMVSGRRRRNERCAWSFGFANGRGPASCRALLDRVVGCLRLGVRAECSPTAGCSRRECARLIRHVRSESLLVI